jgi:putative SOS response-associated peptidase YedK
MGGRYVSPDEAVIEREWHIGRRNSNLFARRFNVQPTSEVPILQLHRQSGKIELTMARWGLIPHWWMSAKPPKFCFNARLEEAATKAMWRDLLRRARCLVPAEGWYEWAKRERVDPATGEVKTFKQPHFIRRGDQHLFCIAGLISWWQAPPGWGSASDVLDPDNSRRRRAGGRAQPHDSRTVNEAHAKWLDPKLAEPNSVLEIVRAHAIFDAFEHYPVRTLVNRSRAEGPELVEAIQ